MNLKISLILILLLAITSINCIFSNEKQEEKQRLSTIKHKIVGSWLGGITDKDHIYSELHFVNDSIYISIQDSVYYHVPDSYQWNGEDTICLAPFSLCYKACINGDTLKLMIKDKSFIFERIKPSPDLITDFFLDGFVIRKYNFLLSKGIISSNEAYKQLYKYIEDYNILDTTYYDVEDENIFPVKK